MANARLLLKSEIENPPKDGFIYKAASDPYLEYIKKINDVFYGQIRIADQKAAYIFTFMLAFMISSAEGRSVFKLQSYQEGDVLAVVISGCLAVAVIVSLVSAILVVLPRNLQTSTALYWGAWAKHRGELTDAHAAGDPGYIKQEYLRNADNLATIARSKYRFVGIAFRGLVVAVVAYVLLLVAG